MDIVVRSSVIFLFLWIVMRALGKRELAEMTPFELVLLVTMGDLIQQGITQDDTSLTAAMLAVSTMAVWILAFSYLSHRSSRAREIIDGQAVVVVRDGKIVRDVVRHERLHEEDVLDGAREQGITDLSEVRLAVLEPNGKFSFITEDARRHEAKEHLAK
jgi:uncharacterized membrane protein YcaP (DUF421 family)